MIFIYPKVLLLLFLIIILIVLYKNKKIQKLENIFSKEILQKLEISVSKVLGKNLRFYLSILALCFMIVALARPIVLDNKDAQEVSYESFNLVVILDISKSMQARDLFPSRLEFAKKSLDKLFDSMSEANIAVIAYANDAFLVSPFSNDFKSIKFLLSHLNSSSLSTNGSQILSALKATSKIYDSTEDIKKAVLLISDGADGLYMDEILKNVKENDFILHVLNVGTKKGITLEDNQGSFIKDKDGNIVISKRDDTILEVAKESGGVFLSLSSDMSKLDWLVREIKKTVSKKDMKKDKYEGARELFYYPLIVSVFLMFFTFNSLGVFSLLILFFVNTNAEAGLLDFWNIKKANESYQNKEYKKAENKFDKLNFDESIYNKSNALYKQKKFKEALSGYESIKSFSGDKELERLYNMGNANAKLKDVDKAIKNYEEALKIDENDEDVKFNLDLLKKQEEDKKKQEKGEEDKEQKQQKQKDSDKKEDKKKDGNQESKEDKNKKKEEQEKKDGSQKSKEESKSKDMKMSEIEAKKWEKKMENKDFTTKPYRLQKSTKESKNAITW